MPGDAEPISSSSISAPRGAASAISRSNAVAIVARILARGEPDRDVGDRFGGKHRLHVVRRAALDPVHVKRRLGEGPQVELVRGPRIRGAGSLRRKLARPGRQGAPAGQLLVGRRDDSGAERLRQPAVGGDDAAERADQCVRRIERGAPKDARVQVASAGAQGQVEVRHPARGEIERRHAGPDHRAVEDHRDVGAALVGGEEFDDRLSAGLLLPIACEADVDRQLAGLGKLAGRAEQHEQLPLVVRDSTSVQMLAPDLRRERRRVPEREGIGGLDIEVPVAQDGRRALGIAGGAELTERERLAVPIGELAGAACGPDELTHPPARVTHVAGMLGIGTDRGDAQELGELVKPGRHGD